MGRERISKPRKMRPQFLVLCEGETDFASDTCIKQLCSIPGWEQYKKAVLTIKQQDSLWDNRMTAVENMKDKTEDNKTYSTVYQFINILEEENQNQCNCSKFYITRRLKTYRPRT